VYFPIPQYVSPAPATNPIGFDFAVEIALLNFVSVFRLFVNN